MLRKITILGVNITNERKDKVLEYLLDRIKNSHEKTFLITPNPEMLVYASKHLSYKDKLNSASIALPDGIGLFFASSLMHKNLKERIPGVDFIEELCKACRYYPLSMGFLGGRTGVAELASKCLKKKYPWVNVVFAGEEWNQSRFKHMNGSLKSNSIQNKKKEAQQFSIDILFVAFGIPKQEEWIYTHMHELPIKSAMGVGGSFDYISGSVIRAPLFVRFIGLEWLFRLIVQPWRWQRQLALIEFIFLVLREHFSHDEL